MKELLLRTRWPAVGYLVVLIFWGGIYWAFGLSENFFECLHFSVDTITLRGRMQEPNSPLCAFASDVQALAALAIIVVWFPIAFTHQRVSR